MRRTASLMVVLALSASLFTRLSVQAQDNRERKVVAKVAPTYPEMAKGKHVGSVVKVIAVVLADGTVKSTKAVGGNPVFIESATEAVRRWKFQAASAESTEVVQLTFEPR